MMNIQLRFGALALLAGLALLGFGVEAQADPPSRVARLSHSAGAVSFSPAGESDWVQSSINRPLTTGDRLWSDVGARAEVQVSGATIRMDAATGISVLNLDDQVVQLQLTQGILNVRVRRLEQDQVFEIDTPNLAFVVRQPGTYRIEADPDGNATTIVVRRGEGVVYGQEASYVIDAPQAYRFTGTGWRESRYFEVPRLDAFDQWSSERDRRYDTSASARYVSQDVVGFEDLDAYGAWRTDVTYGNIWIPARVPAGWAPYRDGHWAWVDPWGWTWIDDAPWGFAVSHYGRWTHVRGTWGWVPGPVRSRAYYAPALVVFVGGENFRLTISTGIVGAVAWFPLGPREVYRPSYPVSRDYFEHVNSSNTIVDNSVINNYYNTSVTQVVYVNRQVPGAVVAVPTSAFAQSHPVAKAALPASREVMAAPAVQAPPVVPTDQSVRGAAVQAGKPPARAFEQPVVARSTPPAARVGLAAQQPQLTARPGQPLDDAARKTLKPAAAAPAPVVQVLVPKQETPPKLRAGATAPAAHPVEGRSKSDAPDAPKALNAPQVQTTPEAGPAVRPPPQRGQSEQRAKGVPREQPVASTPAPSGEPVAQQPKATPPARAVPAAPAPAQDLKREAGPAARRTEPAAASPLASPPPPAASSARPISVPRATGQPSDKNRDRGSDEREREEQDRKRKAQ